MWAQFREPTLAQKSRRGPLNLLHFFLFSFLLPTLRFLSPANVQLKLAPPPPNAASIDMPSSDPSTAATTPEEGDCGLIRFIHVPSYQEFLDRCLLRNRPCILPPALIAHWDVIQTQAWGKESHVDWDAHSQLYGYHISPVVMSRGDEEERRDMSISSAISLIKADSEPSIYIKDWHLIKQLHNSTHPYSVPPIFADDWMNNVPPERDDFRFVYAGTAGSRTTLHRDVYTSYSWSSNVVGKKRWWMFPPHTVPFLRRFPSVTTSELVPDITTLQSLLKNPPAKEYPNLAHAWEEVIVVDQAEGETIFVPSGWYHEVLNLTECVSINHNWCNAVNLPSLYWSIVEELQHVEESLCDVREMLSSNKQPSEWEGEFYNLVQDVAIQDAGWAWAAFWQMVQRNLENPAAGGELRPDDGWVMGRLLPLVENFERREDVKWLDEGISETARRCRMLLEGLSGANG